MSVHIISWARHHPGLIDEPNIVNQTRIVFGILDEVQACEFYAGEFAKTSFAAEGWELLGNPNVLHVDEEVYATWGEYVAPAIKPTNEAPSLRLVTDQK